MNKANKQETTFRNLGRIYKLYVLYVFVRVKPKKKLIKIMSIRFSSSTNEI